MKINNIKIEYLTNPLGIDIINPRITWDVEDCKKQIAYKINYSINENHYSTDRINSSKMNYIFKDKFNSFDHVDFEVICFDENNNEFKSNKNFFEMGILDNNWTSKWICGDYKVNKKKRYPVDYFKKEFNLVNPSFARMYITSCGLYEAFINGKRVGDGVLTPGSTDYHKRIQYQTYDITDLLVKGKNELMILLADGWYRGSIGAKGFTNVFGTVTKINAMLRIIDSDQIITINTDKSFLWSNNGPIRFADLKDGEIIDNNLIPSFNKKAKECNFKANLTSSNNNLVKEKAFNKPISLFVSKTGKIILEFKNNVAGYISFKIKAHKNDSLKMVLGEMLDENNDVTLKNVQCIRKGKKTPLQEINYCFKDGENEYCSKFFYGGFKYLSIQTNIKVNKDDFTQIAIHTDFEDTSFFKCSNELINIFYDNTIRSLKSNSIDIPTDCPTRERMGWTGDSQVFFNTASFLTDYSAFTRKHILDVYDRQKSNGCLPQIAPYSAEDWFMNVMNGSVGWADAGILIPYRFYKKYGDIRMLEDYYTRMVKYAKFMIKRCGKAHGIYALYAKPLHLSKQNCKYGVNTGQSYGEWAEPNDVKEISWKDFAEPHPEESMAYTYYMMKLMVEISTLLNKKDDIDLFIEYRDGIKRAYQELVSKSQYSLDTNRQAKLVRPLYFNLLNDKQKIYAEKRLIDALDFYNYRLGTGFLSTPFILDVLSSIDIEKAYKLLENEKMPGWLYMAKNNTGTIWEGWEGPNAQKGIASLNHYSKGAMVEWLFSGMCGININGENSFFIKPIIGGNINFAEASYNSIYGKVSLKWKKENKKIIIDISIPSNTCAHYVYSNDDLLLESGMYHFEYRG